MEGTSTTGNAKKNARRRVADSISKSPAPQSSQKSPAIKLLAALDKAQGKSAQNPPTSSKQSQKSKVDNSSSKPKSDFGKKGSSAQHQNTQAQINYCGESTSGINARISGSQTSTKEAERSSTSRRVLKNTQNHPSAVSYSLWSVSPTKAPQTGPRIPPEVLQDLTFRFLANIPDEEKSDKVRMCFQVELAHWFYIDFYCKQEERKDCVQMGMREFARQIFKHCDELAPYAASVDQVIDEWRWYKSTVPTYGAILLDESLNYVLLVQGFYAKNSWGFPKGKVNEGEEPRGCAVREVYEETGFNFDDHRPRGGEKKLQKFINETMVRLYIVPDVPTDFPFAPQTRNEIRKIQWFNVWDLPTDRSDQSHRLRRLSSNNFYTVVPFVQDLQKYVVKEQERRIVAATKDQNQLVIKSSGYVFGNLNGKSALDAPTDISDVMDALLSASGFAGTANSGYEKNQSTKTSISSLSEVASLATPSVSNFNAQMAPSYSTQCAAIHPPTTSRYSVSENVRNSQASHFRPVAHSPLGKNIPSVRAGSNNIVQRSCTGMELPHIAHPIAIPAQPALPLINRPVYVAPKDKSSRISLSETSAFTAFKSPSQSSFFDTSPSAVDKIEVELQKLLCATDGEYLAGITSRSEGKTPCEFLDSLSPDMDLSSEFTYTTALPREINYRTIGGYLLPRTHVDGFVVQLCDAWKDFKLDRVAIFKGLPGFETAC